MRSADGESKKCCNEEPAAEADERRQLTHHQKRQARVRGAVAADGQRRRRAEPRRRARAVQVGRESGVENDVKGGGVRRPSGGKRCCICGVIELVIVDFQIYNLLSDGVGNLCSYKKNRKT